MFTTLMRTAAIASLLGGVCDAQPDIRDEHEARSAAAIGRIPTALAWSEVNPAAKSTVLELLSLHTRSNYERITSWRGVYAVHQESYLSPEYVREAFGRNLPPGRPSALIRAAEATFRFTIDMDSRSIYRERDTTSLRFVTADSREPVEIPLVGATDGRSIVTSQHYAYFNPKEGPMTRPELAQYPEARDKRVAHRAPTEHADDKHFGELMDPRRFFQTNPAMKFWEELDVYLSAVQGKDGAEAQRSAAELLRIEEATHSGSTWYRIQHFMGPPQERLIGTSIWSPVDGYHPVSVSYAMADERGDPGMKVGQSLLWKWKSVDGIFVPEVVSEEMRDYASPGAIRLRRVSVLEECALNEPVDPQQFEYAALGLEPGELILDEIDQTVLVMGSNGQPTRLGALRGGRSTWTNYIWLAGAAVGLVAVALLWYRR